MKALFRYLFGSFRIRFFSFRPERLLSFALKKNLPLWNIERQEECVSFSVSLFHRRHLADFFKTLHTGERMEEKRDGILLFWDRFGKRWGFFAGLLFFFSALFLSTKFVWSVDVVGNVWMTETEIREKLEEVGLKPGSRISKIQPTNLALRFQVENQEFSYVSVNLIGTCAKVEVREREWMESEKEKELPRNLVAKSAGKVIRFESLSGKICVERGSFVSEGTLLISGVVENACGSVSLTSAKGRVFAETEHLFEEYIPFSMNQTVYTGREKVVKTYSVLGIKLPSLFSDTEVFKSQEILEKEENLSVFNRRLPILCRETTVLETEEKNSVITVDRAKNLAYDKYEEYKRDTFSSDTEILEETIRFTQDENGITITVTLRAVEDICRELPFSYVEEISPDPME